MDHQHVCYCRVHGPVAAVPFPDAPERASPKRAGSGARRRRRAQLPDQVQQVVHLHHGDSLGHPTANNGLADNLRVRCRPPKSDDLRRGRPPTTSGNPAEFVKPRRPSGSGPCREQEGNAEVTATHFEYRMLDPCHTSCFVPGVDCDTACSPTTCEAVTNVRLLRIRSQRDTRGLVEGTLLPMDPRSAPASPVSRRHRRRSRASRNATDLNHGNALMPDDRMTEAEGLGSHAATDGILSNDRRSSATAAMGCGGLKALAGCCGAMGSSRRGRRPLSGSYSALLDSGMAANEGALQVGEVRDVTQLSRCQQPPEAAKPCSRSLASWASAVSRGTSALMDALPSLTHKADFHVVMIGLDSAGKTTVLYRLKFDQYVNTTPTIGFNCEKVKGSLGRSRNLTFLVWDVGGQEKLRPLWRPYTRATDAVIFVVDSCDSEERLEEARLELHRIMRTPDNVGVPLLVMANKQDLPSARGQGQIEALLELSKVSANNRNQVWHIEPVCAVTGEGLDTALDALHSIIVKRRKLGKRLRNKTR